MGTTDIASLPLKYLDKAVNGLRDLGLLPAKPNEAPIVALINQISDLDEEKALAIARTLSHTSVFNEVVREQITQMKVGERYEKITQAFNSIRDDAKSMVDQLDDGKISTMERLQNLWVRFTRGDIPDRFRQIKDTYLDVTGDTKDQIEREEKILEAYKDFRGALKEAQVTAGAGDGLSAPQKGRGGVAGPQGAPGGGQPGHRVLHGRGPRADRAAGAGARRAAARAPGRGQALPDRQGPGREPLGQLQHHRGGDGAPDAVDRRQGTRLPRRSRSSAPTRPCSPR